jgi:hypothetical protein
MDVYHHIPPPFLDMRIPNSVLAYDCAFSKFSPPLRIRVLKFRSFTDVFSKFLSSLQTGEFQIPPLCMDSSTPSLGHLVRLLLDITLRQKKENSFNSVQPFEFVGTDSTEDDATHVPFHPSLKHHDCQY